MKKLISFSIIGAIALLVSCGTVSEDSSDLPSTTSPTYDPTSSPLYVEVLKRYEGNTVATYAGDCYFNSTDPLSSSKTCTVRIPELELHFSELDFKVGTSNMFTCTQVLFEPYYFVHSNSNDYRGLGKDCSATYPKDQECYGGAAPNIIPNFPATSGYYFLPVNMITNTYKLESSNTRRMVADSNPSLSTNVNAANSLATGARGAAQAYTEGALPSGETAAIAVDYRGSNLFRDYTITCKDRWANSLYKITLIIADENTTVAPHDNLSDYYYDWNDPL